MRNFVVFRWQTARTIAHHSQRMVASFVVLSFAIPLLQWWRDEGPTNHQPPLGADVFGWLPWWAWLIISLVVALAVVFEAAHREITRLVARVAELEGSATRSPEVANAMKALARERVRRRNPDNSDTNVTGVWALRKCATDLGAKGLNPQLLGSAYYPEYGSPDGWLQWKDALLPFLGRAKILGLVKSQPHLHTWTSLDRAGKGELTEPVETFYITELGAAVVRAIEEEEATASTVMFT